jgi:ferredoxin-NADP reductase
VAANGDDFRGRTRIVAKEDLGADVMRVRCVRPRGLAFAAGQFLTLSRGDGGPTRSYSIASDAADEEAFDIHVRRVRGGHMSTWLHDHARPGDELELRGPRGDCFYAPSDVEAPLTFIGIGTGVGALTAVLASATQQGHRGRIDFWQVATARERLYFDDRLKAIAAGSPTTTYRRCILAGDADAETLVGDAVEVIGKSVPTPAKQVVYLCGDADTVQRLRKRLFLAGVSLKRMHADAFVAAAPKAPG